MIACRHRSERVLAAVMALALQAALYRLLLPPQPSRVEASRSPSIIAMILNPTRPHRVLAVAHRSGNPTLPKPMFEPITVQAITPPMPPAFPSRPAVDWQAAIEHEVRAEAEDSGLAALIGGAQRPEERSCASFNASSIPAWTSGAMTA